jgi:hypothetical protein
MNLSLWKKNKNKCQDTEAKKMHFCNLKSNALAPRIANKKKWGKQSGDSTDVGRKFFLGIFENFKH